MSKLRKHWLRWLTAMMLSTAFAVTLYATRRYWLWIPLNPKYQSAEVVGLSMAQIEERFGKPYYRSRAENGVPESWLYTGALGAGVTIDFDDNGRASQVRVASK